jgi:hypothetical protein
MSRKINKRYKLLGAQVGVYQILREKAVFLDSELWLASCVPKIVWCVASAN